MILYHGTDIEGFNQIIEVGFVKPVKASFTNFPHGWINGEYFLNDGSKFDPNIGNPFFLTPQKWYAISYGNMILSIDSRHIKKLYENNPGISIQNNSNYKPPLEFFTFDEIPLDKFRFKFYDGDLLELRKLFYDKYSNKAYDTIHSNP